MAQTGPSEKDEVRQALEAGHAGLLTCAEQAKLRATSLLIAGCGVGSVVAVSAARMGFERFRLVDGDVVETRNLNRQAFSLADVGKPKAEALSAILLGINPRCEVDAIPCSVDVANATGLASDIDIVVDSIDPTSAVAVLALHRAARAQSKFVVSPLDLGWGGALQVFAPGGPPLEQLLGVDVGDDLTLANDAMLFGAFATAVQGMVPQYLMPAVKSTMDGSLAHFPQPVSGAMVAASMTIVAVMRIALGLPVKDGVSVAQFDPWLVHEEVGE